MKKRFNDWYDWINPVEYGMAGKELTGDALDAGSDYFRGPGRAAGKQAEASQRALDAQKDMFDQSLATQKPWLESGERHLKSLSQMVDNNAFAVDPGKFQSRSFTPKDFSFNFQADPSYQFRQDEAKRMIERSAAARGGLKSGATQKELSQYASNLASEEYGKSYNREYGRYFDDNTRDYGMFQDSYNRDYGAFHDDYNRRSANMTNQYNQRANMAGYGQVAAGNVSNMYMQQGQNLVNGYNNIGNARANQAMSTQNALNPLLNMSMQAGGAYLGAKGGKKE